MRAPLLAAVLLSSLSSLSSSPSLAFGSVDPRSPAPGFELRPGVIVSALPLRSQTTTVDVAGVVARIRVEQVWENTGTVPLEATYVFPTSTRAALHDLRLTINDGRELRADIRAREQAQKLFDLAREAGRTAALLEQQRPNAVTMNVTHIQPGDRIVVVVEASEIIRPVDGTWELVLPQTMGPRYQGGGGEAWIDNGHLKDSPVKTAIHVTLRSPIGVRRIGSPSHGLAPQFSGPDHVELSLVSGSEDIIADRDVILRWQLASAQTETGVLLFRDKEHDEGFFLLLGEAPPEVEAEDAPPREVIFVVDVSGSMAGFPLQTARSLVEELLAELRPQDRFNLLCFAGGNVVLGKNGSLPATDANRARAARALDDERGGGGTELAGALAAAFALPRGATGEAPAATTRSRSIVLVTDGFVSAERAVFDDVRAHLGDATLFAFGIGSSVNRHLIEGLAAAGRTEPFVVTDENQAERAALLFRTVSARPALTGLTVAFSGFSASDLEPPQASDLFPGRPLVILGKFSGPSSGEVIVRGVGLRGARYENVIPIEDNLERPSHAPLRQLWARERVARLADRATPTPHELKQVEDLGLRHRLLTERTSFVVVDPRVRSPSGELAVVDQPQAAPRGVEVGVGSGRGSAAAALSSLGLRSGPSVGTGGLGLRGFGGGGGGIATRGAGGGGIGGRGEGGGRVGSGKIIYEGALSREEIERVLQRNLAKVRFCYERELIAEAGLGGKLLVSFTIEPGGTVAGVSILEPLPGVRGPAVTACVERVVGRLQFPAPRGGGRVFVTYPFVFASER